VCGGKKSIRELYRIEAVFIGSSKLEKCINIDEKTYITVTHKIQTVNLLQLYWKLSHQKFRTAIRHFFSHRNRLSQLIW
jgi:hypothetical protein